MNDNDVVIVAGKRTPMGGFMGSLAPLSTCELGAKAIQSVLAGVNPTTVDEVIMGCVLPAGLGQAPARQAMLGAGMDIATGATTINKVCGSGMKAVMLAHDLIRAGSASSIVAGGMESMSNAPYILPKARSGYRMGHSQVLDHMMLDGLENAYDKQAMGCFAQATADQHAISREQMDEFAVSSLRKAQQAIDNGDFTQEIVPVMINDRKGQVEVANDQGPALAKPEKIPFLKPAFAKDGTVTAANSSSISDGAAALLIMSYARAKEQGLQPIARIVAHANHAMRPEDFTIAPVGAIQTLLDKTQWQAKGVDLFEINEAFAMVTMLAIEKLGLASDRVNVRGGACALGHPIGASGARILVTLLHAMQQLNKRKGIASLCIGGGEASAVALELI